MNDFINPEDMFGTAETVLEAVWRVAQAPQDAVALRSLAGCPVKTVLGLIDRGYLTKAGQWAVPELTEKGRERLRAFRTCQDCREECVETVHHCPARRLASPYRDVAV